MDLALPCKETNQLEGHQGAVRAVRFNYDGNYCLTCGGDKLLKLWNPHRGVLLKTYSGHGYEVLDAVGSSDNSRLASCGGDKTVVQWDVTTGQIMRRFRGHTSVSVHASITLSNRNPFLPFVGLVIVHHSMFMNCWEGLGHAWARDLTVIICH